MTQRVQAPHPTQDRTIEGVVVGYDPGPYLQIEGDFVVVRPDKEKGQAVHPAWVTVRFEDVKRVEVLKQI